MYQLASLPHLLLVGASPVRDGLFPLVRIQKNYSNQYPQDENT
jgi:hypothetical protein